MQHTPVVFFFFNDTATTEIYTLSLHDALPICWTDAGIAPQNSINYYDSVVGAMGGAEKVKNSMRLFMAPGMNHCFGGDGPFVFDTFTVLEQWVEKGKAPDQIIAAHFAGGGVSSAKPDRTRPLCPYPLVAKYKGSGSTDDAANFVCSQE